MPRIRTIKPEFWTDEKLAPLRPIDRLVYLGLISMADDAGRLIYNVKMLDGMLFPETDDSSRESIEILIRLSRVSKYRALSGQKLLQIVRWSSHQRVANPSKHVLPAPTPEDIEAKNVTASSLDPHEDLRRPSVDPRSSIMDLGSRITPPTPPLDPAPRSSQEAPLPDEVVAVVILFEQLHDRRVQEPERLALIELCSEHGHERVDRAVRIGAENGSSRVAYIRTVLENGTDRPKGGKGEKPTTCECGAALGPRDFDRCWKCQEMGSATPGAGKSGGTR